MVVNPILVPGVHKYSRTMMKKFKKQKSYPEDVLQDVTTSSQSKKQISSNIKALRRNGVPYPKKAHKSAVIPAKIRPSIKPGTVLIILTGRYAGKRVIALKILSQGLLLVAGPNKINGVPLRRVNHSTVIATSTRIDISSLKSLDTIDDAYLKKTIPHYSKRLRTDSTEKKETPEDKSTLERISKQRVLDNELAKIIKKTPYLKRYLKSKFSLSKGQKPHLMNF